MKAIQCVLAVMLIGAVVNVKTALAQTPAGPSVLSFTLVNPYTDTDVRPLVDYDEFPAKGKYSIRANADSLTGSVVFYLNGYFHHIENEAPYSLFWDHKGNYNFGNLVPGFYTLTATAYTKNNAKGIQGNTLTINFTVYSETIKVITEAKEASSLTVNFYPNPVFETATIDVSGEPESDVTIDVYDKHGDSKMKYKSKLNADGTMSTELDATQFKKGTYILSVRLAEKIITKRLVVE